MTFIEDEHDMPIIDSMLTIFLDELIKLLNRSNDNLCLWIFELFLEFCSAGIAICGSFLEFIILFHGLIIEIFSIHDKEYFFHTWELARHLCCLEARQSLS